MSDKDLVKELLAGNEEETKKFFYHQCYPLFKSIYDHYCTDCTSCIEFINEMYVYIMAKSKTTGKSKLEGFNFESSLFYWVKVVCIYYCYAKFSKVTKRNDIQSEILDRKCQASDSYNIDLSQLARNDIEAIINMMPNRRYQKLIKMKYLDDREPEEIADELCVSIDNYYNMHMRARKQFLAYYNLEDKR